MEYAIIAAGGKQYKVVPEGRLEIEQIPGKAGKEVTLKPVLAVRKKGKFQVGSPAVKGAHVTAKILGQVKGAKQISFKYKKRKGYHRKVGHRQALTRLEILEIQLNGA